MEPEQAGERKRLEQDVRANHVCGPDLDRRDRHQRGCEDPGAGASQAPREKEDECDTRDTEHGDEAARGEIGGWIDGLSGWEEGQERRQHVDEQTRVLVEAMIEIPGANHRARRLDEDDLVMVWDVPETPGQTVETQYGGPYQNRGQSRPHEPAAAAGLG